MKNNRITNKMRRSRFAGGCAFGSRTILPKRRTSNRRS